MSTTTDTDKALTLSCFGISNGALVADKLPDILTLLKFGENPTDRGNLIVNDFTAQCIEQQVKSGTRDHVLIDFEHQSEKGHPNFCPPPRHHAGRGYVFCSAERGLGIERIQWSPAGLAFAKDYPDLSPAIVQHKETNIVHFLSSTALVPQGGVVGLSFYDAAPVVVPQASDLAELRKTLDALAARIVLLEKPAADRPAEEMYDAKAIMALPDIAAILTSLETNGKSIETLSAELIRRDKDVVLERAAREGKLVCLDAGAVTALTVAQLQEHVAKLPATVPISRRTPALYREAAAGGELTLVEQYNALTNPAKRAEFYEANRQAISGSKQ